jgi:hypothetical protein
VRYWLAGSILAGLLMAACSEKETSPPAPSSTATVAATATATATPTVLASPEGGRNPLLGNLQRGTATRPVEVPAAAGATAAILKDVATRTLGQRTVLAFQFEGSVPGYKVGYVDSSIACASGQPLAVAGSAFLSVRLSPAAAHDSNGKTTVASTSLNGDGVDILGARQTCDFEGVVTWVIGVKDKGPFEVTTLGDRLIVAVGGT